MRPARFQYFLIAPTSSPSSGWDQSCLKNLNHLWRTCVKEYNPSSRSYATLFFKLKCICRKRGFSVIRRWLEDTPKQSISFHTRVYPLPNSVVLGGDLRLVWSIKLRGFRLNAIVAWFVHNQIIIYSILG